MLILKAYLKNKKTKRYITKLSILVIVFCVANLLFDLLWLPYSKKVNDIYELSHYHNFEKVKNVAVGIGEIIDYQPHNSLIYSNEEIVQEISKNGEEVNIIEAITTTNLKSNNTIILFYHISILIVYTLLIIYAIYLLIDLYSYINESNYLYYYIGFSNIQRYFIMFIKILATIIIPLFIYLAIKMLELLFY